MLDTSNSNTKNNLKKIPQAHSNDSVGGAHTPRNLYFAALMTTRAAHFDAADAQLMFVLTLISCQMSHRHCGLAAQRGERVVSQS